MKYFNDSTFIFEALVLMGTIYACSVEDFLSVAHPVAKDESVE